MLFQFLLEINALFPATQRAAETGPTILIIVITAIVLLFTAFVLNRSGKLLLAGILLVVGMEMTQVSILLFDRTGGLEAHTVTTVYMLIDPLMLSALLLPTGGIVITAAFNILMTVVVMTVLPRNPAFETLLQVSPVPVLYTIVPVLTQMICAAICVIIIASLRESLLRSDRAEEISKLQRILAEQARQELRTKTQLEEGISEITTALARLGNGDAQARIRLEQGHPLWAVAGNINNMISRFLHLRQQDQYIQQIAVGVRAALLAIHTAKVTRGPLKLPLTGCEVDQLAAELLAYGEWQATKNYLLRGHH
jgi:hypothetical protein